MGSLFAIFQAMWNNYFNPGIWLLQIENWLKFYNLKYDIIKTLATTVFSFNGIAVGATTLPMIPLTRQQNPDSEHFMIQAIRLFDGANATLGETDWALGISDALAKQANITITNAGSVELFELPLREFIPATNDSSSGTFLLAKPIMWKGQTSLTAVITFPTAPTTANYNVALDLIGMKLI